MQASQDYLNTVATEESRKHKLFELEKRLHNQELYSANTVQIDLNRLIDGWNAMEERLDALESATLEAPTAGGGRTRGKKRSKSRKKKTRRKKSNRKRSRRRKSSRKKHLKK